MQIMPEIGERVVHKKGQPICGSGRYAYAIVVSKEPLILCSPKKGGMVWFHAEDERENYVVIGVAGLVELRTAMERMAQEYHRAEQRVVDVECSNDALREIANDLKDAMVMDHLTSQSMLCELREAAHEWSRKAKGVLIDDVIGRDANRAYTAAARQLVAVSREEL